MPRARTPFRTFTNNQGRTFAVRVVPRGGRYGRANCLTNNEGDHAVYGALVEFYDTTSADDGRGDYAGGEGFGPMGQFVTRHYLSSLMGTGGHGSGTGGMRLDGGANARVWSVDEATMDAVREWLATVNAAPHYPYKTEDGRTVWACCESSIGPVCQHLTAPVN
jgi:hypothetical protein